MLAGATVASWPLARYFIDMGHYIAQSSRILRRRARRLPSMLVTLRFLLLLACALWTGAGADAAPTSALRFQRLHTLGTEELSTLALLQDRQGFIWIGTHSGGLVRYNGYQSVKYQNDPVQPNSLPNDRVSALFEDGAGRIWAGTQNGLARFNPETNDFTVFAPEVGPRTQRIIKSIIDDGKGGMWLASWGGLQHFDPASGKFVRYEHDAARADSLASDDINAIALDAHGGLWAATWPGGIDYLAPGTRAFVHYRIDRAAAPDPKLNIVRALQIDARGALWIGTENGVVLWPLGQPWDSRQRLDSPSTRVNSLYADRAGTVWVATRGAGLLRWDGKARRLQTYLHRANDPYSLPADNVRAVMQDRGGMLWVASFTDGIALCNLFSEGFARLIPFDANRADPQPDNWLQAIVGAPDDRLWLSGNSGFALFDPASGAVIKQFRAAPGKPGALGSNNVYSLYQQPGGPLWIGTAAGLHRLDRLDGPLRAEHFGSVAGDFINTIAPSRDGSLWLGTGESLVRYDPRSGAHTAYRHDPTQPDSRSARGATTVLEDSKGRVWIGSEWDAGGLDLLEPNSGRFRHFRHDAARPDSLGDDNVSTIYQDAGGRIWVGTAKGLNELLTGADGSIHFRNYTAKDSIGQTKILAIRADQTGKLWLSTASGLSRLDPRSGRVATFTATDGLSDGFAVGVAHAGANGVLYFGGLKGMTAVSPAQVHSASVAPQVAITDISVFNRSLRDGKRAAEIKLAGPVTRPSALTLSVQESVFSVEFAALHYTDPGRNSYAYRLVGFDRDWIETDAAHRSATYTNLYPGTYLFQVKAANGRDMWSAQAADLTITILPPYWQTWWFRLLTLTLVVALLAFAYRLRVARLTRHQRELEALVAERTRELEASNAKLAALSTTDALTEISNRRGFDMAMSGEWRRAKRTGDTLALAMLDVDHFKSYNDHYGHQAGDQCLRVVAEVIAAHARRTSDVAARYGGEEFALLAPSTDGAAALRLAQEICADLARRKLPHARSPLGVVTISIGVAALKPSLGDTPDLLIQYADQAMYRAKQEGRNGARLAAMDDATR